MRKPLKPFLKWAGGKRWLFADSNFSLPHFSGRYIEPFLGGGAVFFATRPERATLSDANGRLIELYSEIRDNLAEFESNLRHHALCHSKDYYYELRGKSFTSASARAAQFLYLNRTCWNGLYRENTKGFFNVPIGSKQTVIFDSDNFAEWSDALRNAEIRCMDFSDSIDAAEAGDFVFADPPYTVRHNMNGFVKYNQSIFAWQDQIRLRDSLKRASDRGVLFALTNADHESVRELYSGFGRHRQLTRHSVISARSSYRTKSTELLIFGE